MNYFKIERDSVISGNGLRVVVWLSGCPHHCKGCHNPELWDENNGILFDSTAKQILFAELDKAHVSGVTFTGGEPLYEKNLGELENLVKEIKTSYPQKNIWIFSGYYLDDLLASGDVARLRILSMCDVMVDGLYEESLRNVALAWRGSSNQTVQNLKEWFE